MSMSKAAILAELAQKRAEVLAGGGSHKVDKLHNESKLTARERVDALLDKGSFVELDQFVNNKAVDFGMRNLEIPGEGVVTGYGTVGGRLVYIYAQDSTVLGGSLGEMHAQKIVKVLELALKCGAPIIGIHDSGGARIQEGIDALNGYGEIFNRMALASGVIPQIAVIMGTCAGAAAFAPPLMDFVFMVDKSKLFITGPQVVKAVTGTEISAEDLGGAKANSCVSGGAHFYAASETECLDKVKELLDFLPDNNLSGIPLSQNTDDPGRGSALLNEIIPENINNVYEMKDLLKAVADNGRFLEVHEGWAKNILTGFIHLDGITAGVVANQPNQLFGVLNNQALDKGAQFINMCDAFGIPILTFVDTPGYAAGPLEEHGGLNRHGAKMIHAYAEATVLKITVVVRKAHGSAYLTMCPKALGADAVIAWPTARIAILAAEAAATIVYQKEIDSAPDPYAKRLEKTAEYEKEYDNPYHAASRGLVDFIINPDETRYYVIKSLESGLSKMESRPGKKHSNFPV